MIILGYIYISAMDECFLSFKFNSGGKKEKLSKAGSDRMKSMIDSSKVYDDGAGAARLEVGSVGAHRVWGISTSVAFSRDLGGCRYDRAFCLAIQFSLCFFLSQ